MPENTEPTSGNDDPKASTSPNKGFPEGVPVAEMAEAQKAAYYQFHLRKKEDQLKKLPSADELKRLRQAETDLTELRNAQLSDQEKALEAARAQGEQAAADRYRDLLVAAEFRAVAAGRVPGLDELVQDLRLDRYITEAGEPDAVAITARVESLLPAAPTGGAPQEQGAPDLEQGYRTPPSTNPTTSAGRDLYAAYRKRD